MKIITDERCAEYRHPGHPERPQRIVSSLQKLRSQTELPIVWAVPEACDEKSVLRAHSPAHLARLTEPSDFDNDTPFCL